MTTFDLVLCSFVLLDLCALAGMAVAGSRLRASASRAKAMVEPTALKATAVAARTRGATMRAGGQVQHAAATIHALLTATRARLDRARRAASELKHSLVEPLEVGAARVGVAVSLWRLVGAARAARRSSDPSASHGDSHQPSGA